MANQDKQSIGFWGVLFRLINWLFIISLLISYLAQWISPSLFWPIAFFGLAFPPLAIINLLFTVYWLFRRRKFFIYPLLALLIGIPMISRFVQFGNNKEVVDISSPFKILTYNVHVFDQYHSKYGDKSYARDGILNFLKQQDADIYCFQEFYQRVGNTDMDNIALFKKALNTPYSYSANYSPKSKYLYNVILSKYPIEGKGIIGTTNKGTISGIYSDININGSTIRIYSVHLQSFQISSEKDIIAMDFDLNSREGQEKIKKSSIRMAQKFRRAFAARSIQINSLKEHIASATIPVMVVGDFNDTPSSYAYGQLRTQLEDSFMENGSGFGQTYIGPYPSFRIDYILHNATLRNYEYKTGHIKFSDHYPISGVFSADDIND